MLKGRCQAARRRARSAQKPDVILRGACAAAPRVPRLDAGAGCETPGWARSGAPRAGPTRCSCSPWRGCPQDTGTGHPRFGREDNLAAKPFRPRPHQHGQISRPRPEREYPCQRRCKGSGRRPVLTGCQVEQCRRVQVHRGAHRRARRRRRQARRDHGAGRRTGGDGSSKAPSRSARGAGPAPPSRDLLDLIRSSCASTAMSCMSTRRCRTSTRTSPGQRPGDPRPRGGRAG